MTVKNPMSVWKSKAPQQTTGHQACYAASSGVFDPCGIRLKAGEKHVCPLGIPALDSLLAGINHVNDLFMHRRIFVKL